MQLTQNKKAFTILELLIVVCIIGILFLVLVSKLDFATEKAKITGVQSIFRSYQMALEAVARENAGFSTLGWDEGDLNGDRIRNAYDYGDTNENCILDGDETWVVRSYETETWTGIYTLDNPNDLNDKSAYILLEEMINKHLDKNLHITIKDDGSIKMKNALQDPWQTEYHGYYISNALVDGMDRGAIVMYTNGANKMFGSHHKIECGEVTVTVPNANISGMDDLSIAVRYTYHNGYGQVIASTTGFSLDQDISF